MAGSGEARELVDGRDETVDAAERTALRSTCCQSGRKRPRAACGTGSTSARNAASERARTRRSTSGSIHSSPVAPGRNSPSTARRSAARRRSASVTTATPRPNRVAASAAVNGPWVREYRLTRSPIGVGHRVEERARHPDRQRHPERVAQAGGVLDHRPPLDPGELHLEHPVRARQLGEELSWLRSARRSRTRLGTGVPCGVNRSPSSSTDIGPSIRSRSTSPSASFACRSGTSRCSSRSVCAITSGSSSSRSSARPSSSASSDGSSDRAAARRSASGESPS